MSSPSQKNAAKKGTSHPARLSQYPNLNPKQLRFVDEYLIDLNASAAYKRAGYAAKGNAAESSACNLLRNPTVALLIRKAIEERTDAAGITQNRVLQELSRIAFFDLRAVFREDGSLKNPTELDEVAGAALAAVEVTEMQGALTLDEDGSPRHVPMFTKKVKTWSKEAALTLAMKYLKMITDRTELSGPGGGPIQVEAKVISYLPFNGRERVIESEAA